MAKQNLRKRYGAIKRELARAEDERTKLDLQAKLDRIAERMLPPEQRAVIAKAVAEFRKMRRSKKAR